VIDTTWSTASAVALLDWIQGNLRVPVQRAIVTHSHQDRAGGIMALVQRGIPVETTDAVARRLPMVVQRLLKIVPLSADNARVDDDGLELYYPGAGHTPDNFVVWLPAQEVVYGGCLIKAEAAESLGFVGDADLSHWADAVRSVGHRYPHPARVIPGHGAVGGPGAMDHTISLVQRQLNATQSQ
jgi:metallo-beta-lactamase class B